MLETIHIQSLSIVSSWSKSELSYWHSHSFVLTSFCRMGMKTAVNRVNANSKLNALQIILKDATWYWWFWTFQKTVNDNLFTKNTSTRPYKFFPKRGAYKYSFHFLSKIVNFTTISLVSAIRRKNQTLLAIAELYFVINNKNMHIDYHGLTWTGLEPGLERRIQLIYTLREKQAHRLAWI